MDTSDTLFIWKPEYALGIPIIDKQHHALLVTASELHRLLGTPTPAREEVQQLIDSILAQKAEHFATEERLFAEFEYEDGDEHARLHQGFSTHIDTLRTQCGDNVNLFGAKLIDFLVHWFVGHLNTVDKKYVDCFAAHGMQE